MRGIGRHIIAGILAVGLGGNIQATTGTLERQIYQSFVDGDYARAAALIERHLEQTPRDPTMLYNAACAYSHLHMLNRAASYLRRAVEAGLGDLDQILTDPDLDPIRNHPTYKVLLEKLQRSANMRAADALDRWRATYGVEHYRYDRDEERRIGYAIALDPLSYREMRQTIERQADHLKETMFPPSAQSYLLIAVPTPRDGRLLFRGNEQAGGIYVHEERRLIARDTGSSLRHELVHALHYIHMDQLGQRHPLWAQEGLAALYESYVLYDNGSIVFLPNERHNVVRGLIKAGRATKWRTLLSYDDEEFMTRASKHYPQVRSIFEFLADRNQLDCWYRALVETYSQDPTGAAAFEFCFNLSLDDVERSWRRWVLSRPTIDNFIEAGDASLGIETKLHGSNDGVLITAVLPGSAVAQSDLDIGDVIVSVDGVSTRSLAELRTIIGVKSVGDKVTIRARRSREYFTVVVTLRPLDPISW